MDPTSLESAISPRTKAVVVVHIYGRSADLEAIRNITDRHGLRLIEDCAQSTGAKWRGRRLGSIGDIGCFSFYPTKNLGAMGDGGAVATSDVVLANRLARLRQYGWDSQRTTLEPGINSRLDEIQATILRVKLPHLDADNSRRAMLANRYAEGLTDTRVKLPAPAPEGSHVYHLYVIEYEDRDTLRRSLEAHSIQAGIHYPLPAHLQGGYDKRVKIGPKGLPVTEHLVSQILTLPLYPELNPADIDRVAGITRQLLA